MMETLELDTSEDTEQMVVNGDNLLVFRKPQRSLRYVKSKQSLLLYGVLSILLGLATVACGIAAFVVLPFFRTRQSFQVENKWTNIVILFSGISALGMAYRQSLTYVVSGVILSSVAIAMGFTTAIIHSVNLYFRRQDMKLFRDKQLEHPEFFDASKAVGDLNLALILIGLLSAAVSILLNRYVLQIIARSYGYQIHMDKNRLKLSIIGFVQLIVGFVITGSWAGIEALLKGHGINFYALPTGEILCHGLIIVCTGAIQMVTTAKGSLPLLIAVTILNGASLLVSLYFSSYGVSVLYLVMEHTASYSGAPIFDEKMAISAFLILCYTAETILALYSLWRFLKVLSVDRLPSIDFALEQSRRYLMCIAMLQPAIGVLYAVIEVLCVGLFYVYKLDFSSLPVIAIFAGIVILASFRSGCLLLLAISIALLCLCCSMASRDLYLFIYHTIGKITPDMGTVKRFDATNIGIHAVLALLASWQIIVAGLIMVSFMKTMCRWMSVSSRTVLKTDWNAKLRYIAALLEGLFGIAMVIFGFYLFVQNSIHMEDFGDRAVQMGLSFIFAASLSITSRKHSIVILPALSMQIALFTLVWMESDRLTYLVHNYSMNLTDIARIQKLALSEQQHILLNDASFGLSCSVLLMLLTGLLLSAFWLYGTGLFLEQSEVTVACALADALSGQYDDELMCEDATMIDIPRNILDET